MRTLRLSLVLVLTLAFFWGCAQTQQTTVSEPAPSHLEKIVAKGELLVGTAGDMPPLNMTNREGRIIGLEADIARAMADALGVRLKIVSLPFARLLPELERGKVDVVMSGVTITPKRNLKVAFVGPYFVSGKSFLTKKKTLANVKDASQIDSPDTRLAALEGSTSQDFVEKLIPKAQLKLARNYTDAVNLVLKDKVDALIADYPICLLSVLRNPGQGLVSMATPFTYEPVGIAIPASDPQFSNWTVNFLLTLEGSGRLEAIRAYWFGDASWLSQLP